MSARLINLKAKHARAVQAMRTISEEAGDNQLSADQETRFRAAQREVQIVAAEILTEQAAVAAEVEQANALHRGATSGAPSRNARELFSYPGAQTPGGHLPVAPNASATSDRPVSIAPMLRAIAHGQAGQLTYVSPESGSPIHGAMSEGSGGSDGGFLVSEEVSYALLDTSLPSEVVRPRAMVFGTQSPVFRAPVIRQSSRAGGTTHGGLKPGKVAEGATIPTGSMKIDSVVLSPTKQGFLVEVTNELLDDSRSESLLDTAFAANMGFNLDRLFLRGPGAGDPLGVFNAPCLITQAAEGGQTADTINYTNVVKMYARGTPGAQQNGVWVAHPSTVPQLAALTIGSGGTAVWYPTLNEREGSFFLLGRPVLLSELAAPIGDVGDLTLCDFRRYVIVIRKEVTIDKSQHVGFTKDTTTFRTLVRIDGQPMDKDPITPAFGTDTMSPFVTLAAR